MRIFRVNKITYVVVDTNRGDFKVFEDGTVLEWDYRSEC